MTPPSRPLRFLLSAPLLAGVGALLCGCAGPPGRDAASVPVAASATATAPRAPLLLRLSPQSLGRSVALQQQLTVSAPGQPARQLDVLLEADPEGVRLALVSAGQTAARLAWDGRRLTETRAPWLPAAVSSERVLSDLQLVMWPLEAILAALPAGWSLQADGESIEGRPSRVLRERGDAVATVRYPAAQQVELVQHRDGYRLVVESRPLGGGR